MSELSFDALRRSKKRELDRVMLNGHWPQVEQVLGYEFRGWNLNAATRLFGTRKFKKGFFGERSTGHAWGYNLPVVNNRFEAPWIAKPKDDDPRRYFFFKVLPPTNAADPAYPASLVIDYHLSGEYFPLNPAGYTVDYLVYPDPENHDLLLGKSYLELGKLRSYLGYFILEREPHRSGYDRRSHFLTDRQMRTVQAAAEVLVEGSDERIPPQQIAWNIDRQLERVQSSRTRSLSILLAFIEYGLPRLRFPPSLLPFSKMRPAARKRLIVSALHRQRTSRALRDFAKLRTLFLAGYYSDPRVYESIGFVPVSGRDALQGEKMKSIRRPVSTTPVDDVHGLTCDVCVVGSGAGGAVVAHGAAAQGKDVVLIEEGDYVPGEQLSHDEVAMTTRLYKEGGLQTTVDLDMTILQGKLLGGSTVINNAICFRLGDPTLSDPEQPTVVEQWGELGARIDLDRLNESYARVEHMIGVKPLLDAQQPEVPRIDGSNGSVLLQGWSSLVEREPELARWRSGLFRKNYDRCLGCGYCAFGCPYGRKLSMLDTYIPQAISAGARVIVNCHAKEILFRGRRATAVRCKLRDGGELRIAAKSIVIACGAIGSSVLLMKSGVKRNVGSRFSFNAGTPMFARFERQLDSYDGIQMASFVDCGDFMLESLFNPPMAFAVSLPGWFGEHFNRMRDYNRFASAGVLLGTQANGRVKKSSLMRTLAGPVKYAMRDGDLARMRRGMSRLAQLYFAAGASVVYPATFKDIEIPSDPFAEQPDRILALLEREIRRPDDLTLSSAHPQGGNPMSDKRRIGVVDSGFRVHGSENLYVCDASVFPASVRINPQLTIMAMADYFSNLGVL